MSQQVGRMVGRRRRGIARRYGHPVDGGMDVDAGSVWVRHTQGLGTPARAPRSRFLKSRFLGVVSRRLRQGTSP